MGLPILQDHLDHVFEALLISNNIIYSLKYLLRLSITCVMDASYCYVVSLNLSFVWKSVITVSGEVSGNRLGVEGVT